MAVLVMFDVVVVFVVAVDFIFSFSEILNFKCHINSEWVLLFAFVYEKVYSTQKKKNQKEKIDNNEPTRYKCSCHSTHSLILMRIHTYTHTLAITKSNT